MPRAARQARRPLQLSVLAYSSVWEAKNSSVNTRHPPPTHLLFTADTIILRSCSQYFLSGAKGEDLLEMSLKKPHTHTYTYTRAHTHFSSANEQAALASGQQETEEENSSDSWTFSAV